jgi:hypothetical protein
MNTSVNTSILTQRRLPLWASTSLAALVVGVLGAFLTAPEASAQGYRYGIQSNGFNRGGSAIISQRGGLPQNNYTARRPSVSSNSNRGSVTNYYYNYPRRSAYRGYGYRGYGYGYRGYGYGFVPGTVSGTGLQIGPGGGVQFSTGTYYALPGYYGVPTYGFR